MVSLARCVCGWKECEYKFQRQWNLCVLLLPALKVKQIKLHGYRFHILNRILVAAVSFHIDKELHTLTPSPPIIYTFA